MKKMTTTELFANYKHFSERNVPFEDDIVDIVVDEKTPYSEREKWLDNLYFVLGKGYYIKCSDFFADNVYYDKDGYVTQPFTIFMEGLLKIAYVYAYNSPLADTRNAMLKLCSLGRLNAFKYEKGPHLGDYKFLFSPHGYSYVPYKYINN